MPITIYQKVLEEVSRIANNITAAAPPPPHPLPAAVEYGRGNTHTYSTIREIEWI